MLPLLLLFLLACEPDPGDPLVYAFPEGFRWGAAGAAHQIEGGNTKNNWFQFETLPEFDGKTAEPSGAAVDGYARYEDDADLLVELGADIYRLSIEWSRVEPARDVWDEAEWQHYRDVLEALRARGIEPMVTLHHFTEPIWMQDLADLDCAAGPTDANLCGWTNPAVPARSDHRAPRLPPLRATARPAPAHAPTAPHAGPAAPPPTRAPTATPGATWGRVVPTHEPDDVDVLLAAVRSEVARIHTSIPGRVLSYDATTQRATVQPVIRARYREAGTGALTTYLPPAIANVPVAFPSGDGYSITWPLAAGDPVLLVFAERSLDEWRSGGGADNEPRDVRRFDLSDAIALPGGRSPADPIPAEGLDAAAMVIRADELRLGSAAAVDPVALSSLTDAALSQLEAVFTAWVPVPGDGGAVLKTALTALILTGWPASVAAVKVKAE